MKIDHTNIATAVDLLCEGFPNRTRAFWEAGLARMLASPAHVAGDLPIGHFLEANGKPVGVGLTAVAPHSSNDGRIRRINLASWYVAPEHRWRMPVLLRRMMADKSAIYTDLSPTLEVQPLLTSLGFTPLNNGVRVVNLAAAAMLPSKYCEIDVLDEADAAKLPSCDATLLWDHVRYGCLAVRVAKDAKDDFVLLKPSHAKGVPVLQLIYCRDNAFVNRVLPDIARTLVRKGHFGLVLENALDETPTRSFVNVVMPNRRKRYIRNCKPGKGTDFSYSELVFFDF